MATNESRPPSRRGKIEVTTRRRQWLPRCDPWRRLAAAIVLQAARDATNGNGHAAEARVWLRSPQCADLLDALDVDRGKAARWLQSQEPLVQASLPGIW
jgi:hypothetical protein